jgi:hypothetical protein
MNETMTKTEIEGTQLPLSEILAPRFVFHIPPYQRPYAWGAEQAGALFDDLVGFMRQAPDDVEDAGPYFLGSVVLIKKAPSKPDVDVVDGQQRLTTLTILLSALRSRLESAYAAGVSEMLGDLPNVVKKIKGQYRVHLRERDHEFFQRHVQEPGGLGTFPKDQSQLPDSQRNIRTNALLLLEKVDQLTPEERQRLATYITLRCYLVVVTTSDEDAAYRIFSVLNDRGLDLSPTDILKSEILGALPEAKREAYNKKWEDIETDLGRERFQTLFSHIRMIQVKAKPRGTILKEIRDYVKPKENPAGFVDTTLVKYAEALDDVEHANYEAASKADQINRMLKWLHLIDNRDWVPPAIWAVARSRDQSEVLLRFVVDLERLATGMMIMRYNINDRAERYGKLLAALEKGEDVYVDSSPLQLTMQEKAAVTKALDGDVYGQVKTRLAVLLRLDSALTGGEASYSFDNVTVEHVLPQTPAPDGQWTAWFPDAAVRTSWVHRLGNLALLSRKKNSQAQNFDFARKKKDYFTNKVSAFALTTEVLAQTEWTLAVVEARQKRLVAELKKVWRL